MTLLPREGSPVVDRLARRDFLAACGVALGGVALASVPASLRAQASSTVNMEGDFYIPVRPEPKPDAVAQLDGEAVVALEKTLACPCPCTLDIYTCRTTDVTCSNSPAIHRDVVRMSDGGYTGDEIVEQLLGVYGERILMTPRKQGFNSLAYFMPFAAVGTGAVVLFALIRSWRKNATDAAVVPAGTVVRPIGVEASDDELARLNAALREDSR